MPPLTERFGITGGVISAVDIIHGLGVYAGLERIDVPGITGFLDTNYLGKGEYGVRSLEKNDLVFIHVEATDEAGHMGDVERKIQALEDFDEKVVGTVLKGMAQRQDYRILLDARPSDRHRAQDPCFRSGALRVVFARKSRAITAPWATTKKMRLKPASWQNKPIGSMESLIEGRPTWTEI